MKQEKNHYHMIVGEVVFTDSQNEDKEAANAIRANGVLVDEGRDLPVRLLGKAQQILQMSFHKRMQTEENSIEVIDVVLMGFIYLGHLTEDEFNAPPEGTEIKEKKKANLKAVPDLEEVMAETKKAKKAVKPKE